MWFIVVVIFLGRSTLVDGYPTYQSKIPNGANVEGWPGVGHERSSGGGARNSFGLDFATAKQNHGEDLAWKNELCAMDSDGDGFTNGEELGDPYCTWTPGQEPQFDAFITHPGYASTDRAPPQSFCDEYEEPSSAVSVNLTFPPYTVPTGHTTYAKDQFDMSMFGGSTIMITKFAPVIMKQEVVHHQLLYACTEDPGITEPSEIGAMQGCTNLLFAWAVGGKTFCMPSNIGIELDTSKYPFLLLEIHYDNPTGTSGIVDTSGLEVTYVELSQVGSNFESAHWLILGSSLGSIRIPPKEEYYEVVSTQTFGASWVPKTGGAEVLAWLNHGHLLARKIWVTIENPGQKPFAGTCDSRYDFDLQEVTSLPGDLTYRIERNAKIRVHCVYNSMERTAATKGGDETENEMCLGIILMRGLTSTPSNSIILANSQGSTSPFKLSDSAVECTSASVGGGSGSGSGSGDGSGNLSNKSLSLTSWLSLASSNVSRHAVIMLIAWFVLAPIGMVFPLLFKRNPANKKWFLIHKVIMSMAGILTIWGFFEIYGYKNTNEIAHFESTHSRIGLCIFLLVFVQILNGFTRPHKPKGDDEEKTTKRRIWEVVHPNKGRIMLVLAAVNLTLGLDSLALYAGPAPTVEKNIRTVIMIMFACLGIAVVVVTVHASRSVSQVAKA